MWRTLHLLYVKNPLLDASPPTALTLAEGPPCCQIRLSIEVHPSSNPKWRDHSIPRNPVSIKKPFSWLAPIGSHTPYNRRHRTLDVA